MAFMGLAWNDDDRHPFIELLSDGAVKYVGPGTAVTDAAAIRSNFPISPLCQLFYFETRILSKGSNGAIAIGLTQKSTSLNRLPGWESVSFGYHGDDGQVFKSFGEGESYGPSYGANDVVGCGINFEKKEIFFTNNGTKLGTIEIENDSHLYGLYPVFGSISKNSTIQANFGSMSFVFDINYYKTF